MTFKVREELMRRGFLVTVSAKSQLDHLFEDARSSQATYALFGRITKWGDNATEWSGQRDYAGLVLELYDAKTGKLLATSERVAEGVTTPDRCAEWLAKVTVGALLGMKVSPGERPRC